MATYYGVKGSSNWNAGNWSTIAAKDASRIGAGVTPLATDDCILDDWTSDGGGVVWTIDNTACVCKSLVCTGYAGDIAFTVTKQLAASGSVTFDSTHTLSGTGTLRFSAAATLNMGGLTFPGSIFSFTTGTFTLASTLVITGTLTIGQVLTMAGNFSITCNILSIYASSNFVAGQTVTINTAMNITSNAFAALTIKSITASSDTFLHFNGLASACKVAGTTFTDVNCAHAIDNWYGGTLTRTTGIYNVTSASMPAVADVENGVEYGGVDDAGVNKLTGTYVGGGGATVGPFEVAPFR